MSNLIAALMIGFSAAVSASGAQAIAEAPARDTRPKAAVPADGAPASEQLEKELQNLDWKQFKAVITAIPKLKADVDAYGPMGWQYVQANYKTYRWRKSINKLDTAQKLQLAQLIKKSKSGNGVTN